MEKVISETSIRKARKQKQMATKEKEALSERETRFQQMKKAKPSGTKVRFDSSDEDKDEEQVGKKLNLLCGSDSENEEMEPDFSSKIRPEFGDASGAGLFQMEQNFNDDRFKLDEHFKNDERLQAWLFF